MQRVSSLVSRDIGDYLTNYKTWGSVMYNVLEHGLVGDGTTDDTGALQTLINTAIAAGRKAIFFPHTKTGGEYYVTALTNADQVVFFGDNASFVGGYGGVIFQMGDWATNDQLADKAENWLKGKHVNFLGDSITAEGPGKITYVTRVAETLGCICTNYAIGGQSFVGASGFWSTVASISSTADVNVIMGGVNDYLLGVTIGTKDGPISNDTLYSALEKFATALVAQCPNAINVMITPLKAEVSASGATYSQDEVVNAIYFIANKYNFVVIDLYSNSPNLNPNIATLKTRWQPDGIHPNQDYVDKFLGRMVAENLLGINNVGNNTAILKDYCRMVNAGTETVGSTLQKDLALFGDTQTTNNNMIITSGIKIVKTGTYLLNVHSAVSAVNATGNAVCGIALNGSAFLNAVFDFTNLASEHKTLNLSHVITLTKNDTLTIRVANNTNKSIDFTVNILTAIAQ